MGSWGVETFDNDTACDWTYGLEDSHDLALVTSALQAAIDSGSEPLDADCACEALAACEVVARLKGQWGTRNAYTETVDAWVTAHPSAATSEVVGSASSAIDRVLSPPSELLDLWEESPEREQWKASVADLRARVNA